MSLSRAVNFKHRFNHKDQVGFPMPPKQYTYWYLTKKSDIEYPFVHDEVINSTLDGVSIDPVTTKICS
jgi:hypothetical protein